MTERELLKLIRFQVASSLEKIGHETVTAWQSPARRLVTVWQFKPLEAGQRPIDVRITFELLTMEDRHDR